MSKHIALIGMAGVGKSYWSGRLRRELGYLRICCDERIAQALHPELSKLGPNTRMGDWMGFPYDTHYAEREAIYLETERRVTQQALEHIRTADPSLDIVLDTTGSLIYLPAELLEELRQVCTVVYLQASRDYYNAMLASYQNQPRSIVWRSHYHKKPGESNGQALIRCYPELIAARTKHYESLADFTIRQQDYHDQAQTAEAFLKLIGL